MDSDEKSKNIRRRPTFAVGFALYLEHLLPYGAREEKAVMKKPPTLQLGGAWNAAKTLETLTREPKRISFVGFKGPADSPDTAAIKALLSKEKIKVALLGIKERPMSSYYLLPDGGKTWAFGDSGGRTKGVAVKELKVVASLSGRADIRILVGLGSGGGELALAREFFRRRKSGQKNVLIPAAGLLSSRKINRLLPATDLLALNRAEAESLFGRRLSGQVILNSPVSLIFITDGPRTAFLKAGGKIFQAAPRPIKNPKFIAGAGDSAAAAIAFAIFAKGLTPAEALKFALKIGTAVVQSSRSHYLLDHKIRRE